MGAISFVVTSGTFSLFFEQISVFSAAQNSLKDEGIYGFSLVSYYHTEIFPPPPPRILHNLTFPIQILFSLPLVPEFSEA
jgi:hypothetical protein